ncbi:MAG: alpha/beta hydrolase [Bacteroidia bacterium]|nr:alpha/beta hydrolase [Bacteroidia bacterium]
MYYVTVDSNVKIAVYDLNPEGKNVVFFIHGWPVNHKMFEYQFNILPRYGFRCISMDLRGFGNSDAPWSGYSYDQMADDVFRVIKTLDVPSLTLVGFSMGGPVAIRYMSRYNGFLVSKLALLSAAAPSFTKRENYPYGMTVDQVNALINQLARNRPQATADFGSKFFASPITPTFADWFQSLALEAPGHSVIHTAQTLRDSDLRADLPQIHVPTGIFHGVLDQICSYQFAIEMKSAIPNSKLFSFEASGHGIFYDQLEKFNAEFMEFLRW